MGTNKRYVYISQEGLESSSSDLLRRALGSVWSMNKNGIKFGPAPSEKILDIEFGPVMVVDGASAPFSAKQQVIRLSGNPKRFGVYPECLQCGWSSFTKKIVKDFKWANNINPLDALSKYMNTSGMRYTTYEDCVFSIETPLTKIEADNIGVQNKYVYGDVDFHYDYYLKDYEEALKTLQLDEVSLPNLYYLLGDETSTSLITRLRENGTCRAKEYIALIGDKHHTLLIPNRVAHTMKAINAYKEFVPFQAELAFTTDQITAAADALRDSNTECHLMRRISEGEESMTEKKKFRSAKELYFFKNGKRYKRLETDHTELKSYNMLEWIETLMVGKDSYSLGNDLPDGHVFLGPDNNSTRLALSGDINTMRKSMAGLVMAGRIKDILSTSNRSMQEILIGAESHSETILYKIEKHDKILYDLYETAMSDEGVTVEALVDEFGVAEDTIVDLDLLAAALTEAIGEEAPDPIQTIWMANSSDIDIFEYIDTQVKYGEDYSYAVTAYQLVIGNDYFYSSNETDCRGWELSLANLTEVSIEAISTIIENSPTMRQAYQEISNYLSILGVETTMGDSGSIALAVPEVPEYCGGDLILSRPDQSPAVLICTCGDKSVEGTRTACLEDVCQKFANIRNQISSDLAASGQLEEQIEEHMLNTIGAGPELIYKRLLRSGKSIEACLKSIEEILLKALNAVLNYEYAGLGIEATDASGELFYSVVRNWQFAKQEDPFTGVAPKTNKDQNLESAQSHLGRNRPKSGKGIRNVLNLDFKTRKDCPKDVDPCEFVLVATTIPRGMIYEVPYFVYSGTMVDTPPVQPGLEIVPYAGVNNKLLFNFNTGIGDYYARPIMLMPSDSDTFKKVLRAQAPAVPKDGGLPEIRFKSDDPATAFQIFRSEDPPKTYRDFHDKLVKTVYTDVNPATIQTADAASYVEKVKPNTKYYYTFRTIDVHGHFSNPTAIYEVELVDDDGAIYPIVELFDISKYRLNDNVLEKKMMKLLHIVPTISQGMIDEKRSNLETAPSADSSGKDIVLGMTQEPIWGKQFKVRLVSRSTGRKIDLNINFKTKYIKNPEAACALETAATIVAATAASTTAALASTSVNTITAVDSTVEQAIVDFESTSTGANMSSSTSGY